MLPKIDVPVYEVTLPSNRKKIKIRPFLVKEEKLLFIAVETKDNEKIIETTKQVINNCIVEGDIDVDKLPFFDIDYLFIALRAKSVGEKVEVNYSCNNFIDGNKCGGIFPVDIDISNSIIEKNDNIDTNIKLSDKISISMKYPSYAVMKMIMGNETVIEKKIRLIVSCIDKIVSGEKVYTTKDYSKEELKAFVEELTQDQYTKLEEFVDNLPSFAVAAEAVCPKCQFKHNLKYKDFTNFFL